VDEVVLPSREIAFRLAERLLDGGQGDRHPLAGDYVLAEITLGKALDGKTLAEAQLPSRYHLNAVLIKRMEKDSTAAVAEEARADVQLQAGCQLLVVGRREKISRFERECGKAPSG
jgi:trk system potassium uptake protein TrkA